MRYLNEREVGFDPDGLGFPSLDGCQAIVYLTDNGLFGYHNFGGADEASWPERSAGFGTFFKGHFLRGAKGRILYGVCYVTSARGYGTENTQRKWKGELAAFADAVGFRGPIWGYNLSSSGIVPSAYVEFRKSGSECEIWAKKWSDGDKQTAANTTPMHHKILVRRQAPGGASYISQVENQTRNIVSAVAAAGMTRYHAERLRR